MKHYLVVLNRYQRNLTINKQSHLYNNDILVRVTYLSSFHLSCAIVSHDILLFRCWYKKKRETGVNISCKETEAPTIISSLLHFVIIDTQTVYFFFFFIIIFVFNFTASVYISHRLRVNRERERKEAQKIMKEKKRKIILHFVSEQYFHTHVVFLLVFVGLVLHDIISFLITMSRSFSCVTERKKKEQNHLHLFVCLFVSF